MSGGQDVSFRAPARIFLFTAAAAMLAWAVLVLWFGYFRFDDFWSINESRGAHLLSSAPWTSLTADGRWQPLMKASFDAVARVAGTASAWPYYLAVLSAHVLTVLATSMVAHLVWADRGARLTAFAAGLAALNLSAYSLASIATLHGVSSAAASAASVYFALDATRAGGTWRRAARVALAAACALAACLYKESGVAAPALAAGCAWLRFGRHPHPRGLLRGVSAAAAGPVVGVVIYLAIRWALDVPWLPPASRYAPGTIGDAAANAAGLLVQVLPWLLAAAAGTRVWPEARGALRVIGVTAAATIAACAPSLLLSWQSPNFWYAALPMTAVGVAGVVRLTGAYARSIVALCVLTVLTLAATIGIATARGGHQWGPYARTALADWRAERRGSGRTIWIDLDVLAEYGGLARVIGPGDRLQQALRLTSGEQGIRARLCVPVEVGTPYTPRPDDEVFVYAGGRLRRVGEVPAGPIHCLP